MARRLFFFFVRFVASAHPISEIWCWRSQSHTCCIMLETSESACFCYCLNYRHLCEHSRWKCLTLGFNAAQSCNTLECFLRNQTLGSNRRRAATPYSLSALKMFPLWAHDVTISLDMQISHGYNRQSSRMPASISRNDQSRMQLRNLNCGLNYSQRWDFSENETKRNSR